MTLHRSLWLTAAAALTLVLSAPAGLQAEDWPAWRGDVRGSGITSETDLPTEWDREANVRWRTPLPDRGNSTPIVLGDRVFVTQAVESEGFRGVLCFDRTDGELLWKNGVTYDESEPTHRENPYGSASPVTDGERVVAAFGSAGVVCYGLEGNELWRRELGRVTHTWGHSSSPVLHGGLCFVYHGPGEGSALLALDKETGETVWRFDEPRWNVSDRNDGFRGRDGRGVVGSFSTPVLLNTGEREELIMSFPKQVRAFDPETGETLWKCRGLNPLVYTSPVATEDGVVISMGGFYGNSLAVKAGGEGDVTGSRRLWHHVRHNGGVGSGVVKDGYFYYQDDGGVAYCLRIRDGQNMWKARLPGRGDSWGSFLLSGDRIYTLSQAGETVVFKASPKGFEAIAHNKLEEKTNSSPVPSDGELFLRTHEALWCISDE